MRKINKLTIIFILGIFIFILNIGTTFAFWATSVMGTSSNSSGSVSIGTWSAVPPGYIGVNQLGGSGYIRLDQIGTTGYLLSSKYILMSDVNIGGAEFTPIGGATGIFSGEFLGNGYSISNVTITTASNYVGLFARNSGLISGVSLININVNVTSTNNAYAGGITGLNTGNIIKSYTTGSINISTNQTTGTTNQFAYAYGGGISGTNSGAIHNSYSNAAVTVNSTILLTLAKSTTTAVAYAGGLVGSSTAENGTNNTYATGNVSANATATVSQGNSTSTAIVYAAGLVGENTKSNGLNNSFATGNVTSTLAGKTTNTRYSGGLVGNVVSGYVNSSYRLNTQTVLSATNTLGTSTTQENLRLQSFLLWSTADWIFDTTYYPRLKNNKY